ncbi:uncharacterized protein QYS62_011436 [Fusarium acuminatum]|uniref:BTB domain-containing protein n=1 Tax=Fusarium acuminatum TaxID=5515 RepID=A0ABZ2XAP7_9HYPO
MSYSNVTLRYPTLLRAKPLALRQHLTTRLMTFVIGSKEFELSLHSRLFSTLSVRFRVIVKGNKRYVRLEDVDEDVFSRFAQFVYSGSYMDFGGNEQDEMGTSDKIDTANGIEEKPGNATLPDTPSFSPANSDARKPQDLFNSAPSDGPKSLSFGAPLSSHEEDVPLNLFGQSLGTENLISTQSPARFLFSLASYTTTTENGSGCICSNQTAPKAQVPVERKYPSGMCSFELHKSGQCENKKRFSSNFVRSHIPTFRFGQNTVPIKPDPQTGNFQKVLI